MKNIKFYLSCIAALLFPIVEVGILIWLSKIYGGKLTLIIVVISTFVGLSILFLRGVFFIKRSGVITNPEKLKVWIDSDNLNDKKKLFCFTGEMMLYLYTGIMLLIPGLLTDLLGLLFLFPPLSVLFKKQFLKKQLEKKAKEDGNQKKEIEKILHLDTIAIEIGFELLDIVKDLQNVLASIRRSFIEELGVVLPGVRIRDNMMLLPNEYSLLLRGVSIAKGEVFPDMLLTMKNESSTGELKGKKVIEPAFGGEAVWISKEDKKEAEKLQHTVVPAYALITTHFAEVVKKNIDKILTRQATAELIDTLKKRSPALLDVVYPEKISLATIHRLLQFLLKNNIPIRDLDNIFEHLGDVIDKNWEDQQIFEYLKEKIKSV